MGSLYIDSLARSSSASSSTLASSSSTQRRGLRRTSHLLRKRTLPFHPRIMVNTVGHVLNSVVHLPMKLVCIPDSTGSPPPSAKQFEATTSLDSSMMRSIGRSSQSSGSVSSSEEPFQRPITPPMLTPPPAPTNTPSAKRWNAGPIMEYEQLVLALSQETLIKRSENDINISHVEVDGDDNEIDPFVRPLSPPNIHYQRRTDTLSSPFVSPPATRSASPNLDGIPFHGSLRFRNQYSRESTMSSIRQPRAVRPTIDDIFPLSRSASPFGFATLDDVPLSRAFSPPPSSPKEGEVSAPAVADIHESLCRLIAEKCLILTDASGIEGLQELV